jgi:hypothetical protein
MVLGLRSVFTEGWRQFYGIYRVTVEMFRLWMLHYAIEIYLRFFRCSGCPETI